MSLKATIDTLSSEIRNKILNELQLEKKNKFSKYGKWVQVFEVDEKEEHVFVPYSYGRNVLGWVPPQRNTFPNTTYSFQGELRDYQSEVKTECIRQLNAQGCCLLSLHVGWGKSIFSVYLAHKLKFKSLIIVNRLVLANQWKELVNKYCPDCRVEFIKPKSPPNPDEVDVFIVNALNVSKFPLTFFSCIGTLIVDEVHLICAETLFKSMFRIHPRYVIGLSATPTRPDGLNSIMDFFFGTHRIVKQLHKEHEVYIVNTGIKIPFEYNWEGKIDWNSVLTNQADHTERNQVIIDILTFFSKRSFLVLCKRISQGKRIVSELESLGESVTHLLGNTKKFDEDARIVVATTSKCGVGFSHDRLDALLLATDVEEYFIQYLGRVFRRPDVHPIVFDIVDNLPVLKRHSQSRKKVYRQSGGIIKELKVGENWLDKSDLKGLNV